MSKQEACASYVKNAKRDVTTPPAPFHPGRGAAYSVPARLRMTLAPDPTPEAAVNTVDPDIITGIRLSYRMSKQAERSRIQLDQQLAAFARVYLTDWSPDGAPLDRSKALAQVTRVLKAARSDSDPTDADRELYDVMLPMVQAAEPTRLGFEAERKSRRKIAEKLAATIPAWERLRHIRGLSAWGLVVLVGEAGDIGHYSGCRKLYKRLGLAPDSSYPKGGKSAGRAIPRNTRGRVMGVIADALLRAQWRGAKGDEPAHAIGPYGAVYGDAKQRALVKFEGHKGHSEKFARRVMIKALIHDVHRAWHNLPLDYAWSDACGC